MDKLIFAIMGVLILHLAIKIKAWHDDSQIYQNIKQEHKNIYVPSYIELMNKKTPAIEIINHFFKKLYILYRIRKKHAT